MEKLNEAVKKFLSEKKRTNIVSNSIIVWQVRMPDGTLVPEVEFKITTGDQTVLLKELEAHLIKQGFPTVILKVGVQLA